VYVQFIGIHIVYAFNLVEQTSINNARERDLDDNSVRKGDKSALFSVLCLFSNGSCPRSGTQVRNEDALERGKQQRKRRKERERALERQTQELVYKEEVIQPESELEKLKVLERGGKREGESDRS
jgi:hypothetical protein